jgi:streptogramin lyase
MKNPKRLFILFLGTLIVVAIGWILHSRDKTIPESPALNCLEPHLKAIPSPMPQKDPRTVTWDGLPLAVPDWWKPQLNNLQQIQYDNIMNLSKFYTARDILAYGNQVWIAHNDGLVRFDSTQNTIKTYQITADSSSEYYSFSALYLRNEELWAILSARVGVGSTLAKYDSTTDEFRVVHDKNGLLNYQLEPTVKDTLSIIGELSDGRLVFILGWEIFSYDPATQQAKKLLGLDTGLYVMSIAIAKDDTVWFTVGGDFVIRSLNPVTGDIKEYGEPPSLVRDNANQAGLAEDSSKAIAVDDQGRVWVGYFDRLEPDGKGNYTWQKVKRPAIFVDDTHIYDTRVRAVYVYKWTPAVSVQQFSDGNLWFSTELGIVQYDTSKDNWCWSATQPYPGSAFSLITEDEKGNVWMVSYAVAQIYKLER